MATAILTLRAALGPFRLPETHTVVGSPFFAEGAFWLALLVTLLFCGRRVAWNGTDRANTRPALAPWLPLAVGFVIALAFAHNLADPFLSDDYTIVSGPAFHWSGFLAALHRAGGDGSWRPLTTAYYQTLIALGGTDPVKWHVPGLVLHLLNSLLVFAIAWRLWRNQAAAVVSSLAFGLNGTRPEVALWTAGNADLLACACVLAAIFLASGSSRTGFAPVLLLSCVGICFKESAYALPLIAACILWPHARNSIAAAAIACATLFAWRWHLFHGPGGYADPATGRPAIFSLHPLPVIKALLIRTWAVLLTPVNWDAPHTWWLPLSIGTSMLGMLYLATTNREVSGRSGSTQLRLIAATCCAVLPAIHLALIGQSAMGSRVLYLPGALFALLPGSLLRDGDKRRIAVAAMMLLGMAGILEHNLSAWHSTALQAEAACRTAQPGAAQPGTPVPVTNSGVPLFQNGFAECVASAHRTAESQR